MPDDRLRFTFLQMKRGAQVNTSFASLKATESNLSNSDDSRVNISKRDGCGYVNTNNDSFARL